MPLPACVLGQELEMRPAPYQALTQRDRSVGSPPPGPGTATWAEGAEQALSRSPGHGAATAVPSVGRPHTPTGHKSPKGLVLRVPTKAQRGECSPKPGEALVALLCHPSPVRASLWPVCCASAQGGWWEETAESQARWARGQWASRLWPVTSVRSRPLSECPHRLIRPTYLFGPLQKSKTTRDMTSLC